MSFEHSPDPRVTLVGTQYRLEATTTVLALHFGLRIRSSRRRPLEVTPKGMSTGEARKNYDVGETDSTNEVANWDSLFALRVLNVERRRRLGTDQSAENSAPFKMPHRICEVRRRPRRRTT
jgi:hypothetical protein